MDETLLSLPLLPAVPRFGIIPAATLKYNAELPEVVMRRFVENKPVIPGGCVYLLTFIAFRR